MDNRRCEMLESRSVATRRGEVDCETARQRRRCNRDKHITAVSWLFELPLPLLNDILIRIPVETVFSCRCVCKSFLKILSDPQFAQDHFTTTEEDALVIQNNHKLRDILFVYSYVSELKKTDHTNSHCQTLSIPASLPQTNLRPYIVGSCNGLLCICYFGINLVQFYVCNPILGEFLSLPPLNKDMLLGAAFGFCPKTKHYKVILFFISSPCKIHMLGTDCWREISGNIPNAYVGSYHHPFRGFLHWIVDHFTVSKLICSFNLETEQASFLPTPSHFTHDTLPKLSRLVIGTLSGLFCLSYHHDTTLEVCVMKNYGVKESWSKAFSINLGLNPDIQDWNFYRGYAFINGELFFKHEKSSLVCYNLQKGTITKLLADDVLVAQIRPFRPSFISLKDVAADFGGNVEVVDRKMRRNNWSDKGFEFIR